MLRLTVLVHLCRLALLQLWITALPLYLLTPPYIHIVRQACKQKDPCTVAEIEAQDTLTDPCAGHLWEA